MSTSGKGRVNGIGKGGRIKLCIYILVRKYNNETC
jgi:hypothetical protein